MSRTPVFLASESTMSAYQARLDQLSDAFPECDVLPDYPNGGRWMTACVVDQQTGAAVSVPLRGGRWYSRTWSFVESELAEMRRQLGAAIAVECL